MPHCLPGSSQRGGLILTCSWAPRAGHTPGTFPRAVKQVEASCAEMPISSYSADHVWMPGWFLAEAARWGCGGGGTLPHACSTFVMTEGVLLASRGGAGMLFNVLQCPGQPVPQRMALMSLGLRWENPGQVQVFCPLETDGTNRRLCAHFMP